MCDQGPRLARDLSLLLFVVAGLGSCTGTIADTSDESATGFPSGAGGVGPGGKAAREVAGLPGPGLAAGSRLRRLTVDEYDRTIFDLLGDTAKSVQILPNDARAPFDNDYTKQTVSTALVTGAELLAADIASRLLANATRRDRIVGCKPAAGDVMGTDCLEQFISSFGRLAWRRTLLPDEVSSLMKLQLLAQQDKDFYSAVDAVLHSLLQDPQFLFRVEVGTEVAGSPGLFKLTGAEMATRLSYFLLGTTPDDGLIKVGETGGLDTSDQVRAVAGDLLRRPAALKRIARFHAMWMGYEHAPLSPLASVMAAETDALIGKVIFQEARPWQDLLRSKETYVTYDLGVHYGITGLPAPLKAGSSKAAWVPYGASKRQGLLSHATFLQLGVKNGDPSVVFRGKGIRELLLCQTLPPKPANLDTSAMSTDSPCKREQAMARVNGCGAGCHSKMDPVGLGLERYDGAGTYITSQSWKKDAMGKWAPVAAGTAGATRCEISGDGDLDGTPLNGPAELAALMLASPSLNACATKQLYRFAMGRTEIDGVDQQFLDVIAKRIGTSDFSFHDLLLDFVSSGAFGHRAGN